MYADDSCVYLPDLGNITVLDKKNVMWLKLAHFNEKCDVF